MQKLIVVQRKYTVARYVFPHLSVSFHRGSRILHACMLTSSFPTWLTLTIKSSCDMQLVYLMTASLGNLGYHSVRHCNSVRDAASLPVGRLSVRLLGSHTLGTTFFLLHVQLHGRGCTQVIYISRVACRHAP
jgi:hypothetical protein